jgi:hypothetical protein
MRMNLTLLTSMASLLIGSACAYREAPRLSDGGPQNPGHVTTTSPEAPTRSTSRSNLRSSLCVD